MPKEIVHIQVGQCGNQIGSAWWNAITKDHELSPDGIFTGTDNRRLDNIGVYFNEYIDNRYRTRACFIDTQPGVIDILKASPIASFYKPDNMIFGCCSSYNKSPMRMIYTEGAELIDEAVDVIRKDAESCDALEGFQFTHSIGGYTGSFLGSLLLLKIRDNYPDKMTTTHSVFPSQKLSDVVVEPYNAILCIHQLLENSDFTFVLDNEALYNISHNRLKQKEPKYNDLNWIIATIMSGCTASLRFESELNSTLRKMGSNLVPFPRLHFFSMLQAPLCVANESVQMTCSQVCGELKANNNTCALLGVGKLLTSTAVYRGDIVKILDEKELIHMFVNYMNLKYLNDKIIPISMMELCHVYYGTKNMNDGEKEKFVEWIPEQNKSEILKISAKYTDVSGALIANTTAIKAVFMRLGAQFAKMYKRKAFLHWYKGEGFDEMEFQEADKNVRDLVTEYNDKEDAVVEFDTEEIEEDMSDDVENDNEEEDF